MQAPGMWALGPPRKERVGIGNGGARGARIEAHRGLGSTRAQAQGLGRVWVSGLKAHRAPGSGCAGHHDQGARAKGMGALGSRGAGRASAKIGALGH